MKYRYTDKCVGCYLLRREVLDIGEHERSFLKGRRKTGEGNLIVYDCMDGRYQYKAAISGLLKPCVGINNAAHDCPRVIEGHCIFCSETQNLRHYGPEPLVYICGKHDKDWGTWLAEPDSYGNIRREYLTPRGRVRRENWIELFREFVEEMRQQLEGEP